jgi:hypothetical protein
MRVTMKKPAKKAMGGMMGRAKPMLAAASGLARPAASAPARGARPFKTGGKAKKC